jgi:hypothetical protein
MVGIGARHPPDGAAGLLGHQDRRQPAAVARRGGRGPRCASAAPTSAASTSAPAPWSRSGSAAPPSWTSSPSSPWQRDACAVDSDEVDVEGHYKLPHGRRRRLRSAARSAPSACWGSPTPARAAVARALVPRRDSLVASQRHIAPYMWCGDYRKHVHVLHVYTEMHLLVSFGTAQLHQGRHFVVFQLHEQLYR